MDTNKNGFAWGYMIGLSNHMWNDELSEPKRYYPKEIEYDEPINTEIEVWDKVMPFISERQFNLVLIDVGDGIKYDSHPEISASNAWSKDLVKKKLAEMRALGLEPIPKLNFSAGHDTWTKKYRRMISTPEYYTFCADIIKEVCEIFDHPRYFHLGLDEEKPLAQWNYEIIISRGKELWWHDFYFLCDQCEKNGARPWIWSDYMWNNEELFLKRMPKSVIQSNWFYGEFKDYPEIERSHRVINAYHTLNKHGYDQIPTGSLYGAKSNLRQTLAFGKLELDPEHLLGYLVAPWVSTTTINIYCLFDNAQNFYFSRKAVYPEITK